MKASLIVPLQPIRHRRKRGQNVRLAKRLQNSLIVGSEIDFSQLTLMVPAVRQTVFRLHSARRTSRSPTVGEEGVN